MVLHLFHSLAHTFVIGADAINHHAERRNVIDRDTPSKMYSHLCRVLLDGYLTKQNVRHELVCFKARAIRTGRNTDHSILGLMRGYCGYVRKPETVQEHV